MSIDRTFNLVDGFVYREGVQFQELQWLCLGMAIQIDQLRAAIEQEAEYSRQYADKYTADDPERSARHRARADRLDKLLT